MRFFAIDFETYYDKEYSLKNMGTEQYVLDERFDPYLVAIVGPGIDYVGHPDSFDWSKLNGEFLVAHNARFDRAVFDRMVTLGMIKECEPSGWGCTADLSVYLSAPRHLAGAVEALLGRKVDKSTRARLMRLTWEQVVEKGMVEEALRYAELDAKYCYLIWEKFHEQWPPLERRLSEINREQGRSGVYINSEQLEADLKQLTKKLWEAEVQIPWDKGTNKTPISHKMIREHCRESDIWAPSSFAKDSEECAQWEEEFSDQFPWVKAIRDWRQCNTFLQRLTTMKDRLREDGTMPFSLKYYGAHTGRWSGDDGFNMQNMLKKPYEGVDMRSLIIPRPGKKFIIADFSQIEARILLWLTDQLGYADYSDILKQIADGLSVYEAHAVASMGWKSGDVRLAEADPQMYALAKARVLALGYGCGWKKFIFMAQVLAKLELEEEESQRVVEDFRRTNPGIPALWKYFHSQISWAAQRQDNYEIELPSGRSLKYHDVRKKKNEETGFTEITMAQTQADRRRYYTYGGKLVENVVQAIARDVLAEALVRTWEAGYTSLWHIHDEIVFEVDAADTESLEKLKKLMEVVPEWLEGCPIAADDIMEADKYCK